MEVRYPPPPQKGYLSDTGAIPYENKANGCDTPLCDTISKRYCAIGGVARTGPLRSGSLGQHMLNQPRRSLPETGAENSGEGKTHHEDMTLAATARPRIRREQTGHSGPFLVEWWISFWAFWGPEKSFNSKESPEVFTRML